MRAQVPFALMLLPPTLRCRLRDGCCFLNKLFFHLGSPLALGALAAARGQPMPFSHLLAIQLVVSGGARTRPLVPWRSLGLLLCRFVCGRSLRLLAAHT